MFVKMLVVPVTINPGYKRFEGGRGISHRLLSKNPQVGGEEQLGLGSNGGELFASRTEHFPINIVGAV
jgi:hypothetical protein